MIRIAIQKYLDLGIDIQALRALFNMLETPAHGGALGIAAGGTANKQIAEMEPWEKDGLVDTLTNAMKLCQELGLAGARKLLSEAIKDPPETLREFRMLVSSVRAGLDSRIFLCIPEHLAQYYESDLLVSDSVKAAFPGAASEIRSAADSLAVGLSTACVFHAMRAAEIGVRALGTALRIELPHPIELAEWAPILNGVHGKIRDIENQPRTSQRDEDLAFYGESAAQLRFFKDGWRVRVAHARGIYNESQAKDAIDHVRSFFEILATRLKE